MKENSIEEDIKIALDKFLDNKDIESAIFIVEKFILGNYVLVGGRNNIVKDSLRYILSDYKRVQKELEELKDTNCLVKRYFKLKDTNTYLQKENDELKKENEELKQYLITQNCEINRLNLDKIRLELLQVPDTTEQYKYLKNEYKMRLERTDLENYKLNYISIQKIKDKIEELKKQYNVRELDFIKTTQDIRKIIIQSLEELIEGKK